MTGWLKQLCGLNPIPVKPVAQSCERRVPEELDEGGVCASGYARQERAQALWLRPEKVFCSGT